MSITLPDSRALLRLALASIALALGLGRAAVASEVTTPVEELHAGLMAIMKAGKTAPFRQRYDMIGLGQAGSVRTNMFPIKGTPGKRMAAFQRNAISAATTPNDGLGATAGIVALQLHRQLGAD